MNRAFHPSPSRPNPAALALSRRLGPLALIVLLHVGFFYALQSGLLHKTAVPTQAAPKEIFATFVAPEPAPALQPQPPQPRKAPPKPAPVIKKPISRPKPPVVHDKLTPAAVTSPVIPAAPPSPPQSAAPVAAAAAPPPVAAPPAQPKTISGVEYLQPPSPDYPAMSRRMREEGTAILRVLVNERGRAERVELQKSAGSPRLDNAARQAVLRAAFKPYIEDGKALAVFVVIPIKFQLD